MWSGHDSNFSTKLATLPWRHRRLSWPSWLPDSGQFTHQVVIFNRHFVVCEMAVFVMLLRSGSVARRRLWDCCYLSHIRWVHMMLAYGCCPGFWQCRITICHWCRYLLSHSRFARNHCFTVSTKVCGDFCRVFHTFCSKFFFAVFFSLCNNIWLGYLFITNIDQEPIS